MESMYGQSYQTQIAINIRKSILAYEHHYEEDDQIPSAKKIGAAHGVGHLTVLKAEEELLKMGILSRELGYGTKIPVGARALALAYEKHKWEGFVVPNLVEMAKLMDIKESDVIKIIKAEFAKGDSDE